MLQRALARASPHIWFERSEVKDREAVAIRYNYLNIITFFCLAYFVFYVDYQFYILYELLIHYIFLQAKETRIRSYEPTDTHIPGGYVYQQYISYAIQKRQF